MDEAAIETRRARISRSGLHTLNHYTDEFRRLVKRIALQSSEETDGLITEEQVAEAVRIVSVSRWFEESEVRHEQRAKAA